MKKESATEEGNEANHPNPVVMRRYRRKAVGGKR